MTARKLIGVPLAGILLVAGATAVLAQTGAGATITQAAGQATGAVKALFTDVLDDLVADGTINQDQADAIVQAVQARHAELREQAQAMREQMRTFLEDGTLSAEELAQLPADHPLRNLDSYLEDGQLTEDELRELRHVRGPGRGSGHGHGPWGGPGIHGAAPDASGEPGASGTSDT